MKKLIFFLTVTLTGIVLLFTAGSALACTTMIITKGASADGSMMVAHSDDDELGDQRFIRVPSRFSGGE